MLIALQCLGLPLALLISPPEKLIRTDGTKAVFDKSKTPVMQGLRDFWKICKVKRVYLLVPIFLTWQWGQAQQGMYLAAYFTVGGRVVAGFVVALLSTFADLIYGQFLDSKIIERRSIRARVTWISLAVLYTATWIYNFVTEADYSKTKPTLDYTSPGYARAVAVYCLWRYVWVVGDQCEG